MFETEIKSRKKIIYISIDSILFDQDRSDGIRCQLFKNHNVYKIIIKAVYNANNFS